VEQTSQHLDMSTARLVPVSWQTVRLDSVVKNRMQDEPYEFPANSSELAEYFQRVRAESDRLRAAIDARKWTTDAQAHALDRRLRGGGGGEGD